MKKLSVIALIVLLVSSAEAVIPAFPGAEGAGMYAVGGRGGRVVEVTNLDDSGAGSFREALNNVVNPPPKIIVFRVSGTIELSSSLSVGSPGYITIAGQTAPGGGITLKNYALNIGAPQVIVRYIRVRLGERKATPGGDLDCMSISTRGSNIIVDHCSFSWGTDETLSPESPTPVPPSDPGMDKLTVQWCILSNPLSYSVHTEGEHGKATLAYGCYKSRFSFHHNIYAHSIDRNPRVAGKDIYTSDPDGLWFDFRNNVVYNWGGSYPSFSRGADRVTQVNFVGNYYKSGVNSAGSTYAYQAVDVHGKGYFKDNWMNGVCPDTGGSPWDLVWFYGFTPDQIGTYKQSSEIPIGTVKTDDGLTAYEKVLVSAGASIPYRDSVDVNVVNDIRNGTGEVIDCTTPGDFYYRTGYAKGGGPDKIILADTYPGREKGQIGYDIEIISGTGAGQVRAITYYHDHEPYPNDPNHWFTVAPDWDEDEVPDTTSLYGVIVDCTKNAGGWPVLSSTTPPTDSDYDGLPDEWETARGLNPNNSNDSNDIAASGYSYLEEYLNWLVAKGNPVGNFDTDGEVNFRDYALLAKNWLMSDCNDALIGSLDYDCNVDYDDLEVFVLNWLESIIE